MMSIRYSDDTQASKFAVQAMPRWCWRVSKKHRWVRCVKSGIVTLRLLPGCR